MTIFQDDKGAKEVRHCHICSILGPSEHQEPKSLPLAKPGVHRRKGDILKYKGKGKEQVKAGGVPGQMSVTEVGGEGGKIYELKIEPDDLIDSEFGSKRTRLEEIEDGVKIKVEVEDDDDIQEIKLMPKSSEGHLTMPYPPPLASIATGQIVATSGVMSWLNFRSYFLR